MADDPQPIEAETPWALFKRLRAEGHPRDVIVERLKELGLSADDIRVLTLEVPRPGPADIGLPGGAVVAALVLGGPILGGLALAAMTPPPAPSEPPPPQVALAVSDTSARCPRHPQFASVGVCPRCGSFLCRECAGPGQGQGAACVQCQASPAVRDELVKRAGRYVALASLALVGILALVVLLSVHDVVSPLAAAVGAATFAAPILLLGLLQFAVRSPWPGVLVLLYALILLVSVVVAGGEMNLLVVLWVLGMGGVAAAVFALIDARRGAGNRGGAG
ncbi:MAG: hypothetical protein ACYC8T_38690 [Myxococcaceae bacterium]